MRRRAFSILLLPIVIFIFIIGWSLSWIGEQQTGNRAKAPKRETVTEEGADGECMEVGLIENLTEKILEA